MQFHFPTGLEEEGKHFTKVQSITVETYSYHPRTNRRKLRKFIQDAWGVKPQFVKLFLKEMGFWTPEQLGESAEARQKLYAEALKWQQSQTS
ncbi:hypothetical protein phiV141_21 [Vibrio phage phiV141]|uniref:Uncharacterized protein n=1 Tax=Vibrio phage phiV141 TaxID=2723905 RepID=A0A7D7EXW7_9CAUD|nr:hypothetical protein phiV141_21 [Vibrio phage phiV141]